MLSLDAQVQQLYGQAREPCAAGVRDGEDRCGLRPDCDFVWEERRRCQDWLAAILVTGLLARLQWL